MGDIIRSRARNVAHPQNEERPQARCFQESAQIEFAHVAEYHRRAGRALALRSIAVPYSLPISIRLIISLTAASVWLVLALDIAGPGHPETGV